MIKINNLLAQSGIRLDSERLSEVIQDNRFTGHTTGKLLTFLGNVISNPDEEHTLPKNPHGYRATALEFELLKLFCYNLNLKCMEFNNSRLTIKFKLHSYYDNEYELLHGREL